MSKKRRERYKRQKQRNEERRILNQFQYCKTLTKKDVTARKKSTKVKLQDMEDMSRPPTDYGTNELKNDKAA